MSWIVRVVEDLEERALGLRSDKIEGRLEQLKELVGVFRGNGDVDVQTHAMEGMGVPNVRGHGVVLRCWKFRLRIPSHESHRRKD